MEKEEPRKPEDPAVPARQRPAWGVAVVAFVIGAVMGFVVASNAEPSECREARERLLSGELVGFEYTSTREAYELACGRTF